MQLSDFQMESDTLCETYQTRGYVVLRGVVSAQRIDRLLHLYRSQIIPARYPFFRQNTNAYEPNRMTTHGFVRQSFLDIHDYVRYPEFSRAALDIFCSSEMMQALEEATGYASFSLMQSMLFDLNTETPGHQDWYYLDSVPAGQLTAAWIALEDIDERAGRFYVLPGSHNTDFDAKAPGRTHAQWLDLVGSHVQRHREQISAPALRRGDVLFWNSRTVHGSLPTLDDSRSRKSLTAHYLPGGFEFGNLFSVKQNLAFKRYQGVNFYRNQPDFSYWNRVKFMVKTRAYNYPRLREALRATRARITGRS
jgi:phytanoyl-CoA hydroxylase